MATTEEQILEQLRENNRLMRDSNRSGSGLQLPKVTEAIGGVFDSLSKLSTGTYTLQSGLSDASNIFGIFPGVGKVAGDALQKVGMTAIAMNDSLKDASKSGYTFDQNLGNFSAAITGARLSLPEFQNLVKENSRALAGLAGTASNSAGVYLKISKDLAETSVARELQATGMGFEEINKVLTISTANRRGQDLSSKASQDAVVDSAVKMAVEMDNVARLTGISRQEQQRAIEAQMKKNEVEIAMLAMSADEKIAYEASISGLNKYGKDFQDVLTAFTTGGLRTAEDTAKAAALGPEFTRLVKELSEIKGNDAGAQRRREVIQAQIDAEALRLANDKEELKIRSQLATAGGEYGRTQASVIVGMKSYLTALQNIERDAIANGKTVAEQRKAIEEKFAKERGDALKGTGAPGTEITSIINRTEAMIKDVSAGVGLGFKDLNDKIKTTIPGLEGLNNVLKPFTTGDAVKLAKDLEQVLAPKTKNISEKTETVPEKYRESAEVRAEKRIVGSKEATGKWFEDFGLGKLMQLDGEEAVVPKNKTAEFVSDMVKQMPGLLETIQKDMGSALSEAKASVPTTDTFQQMFNSIKPIELPTTPQQSQVSTGNLTPSNNLDIMTDVVKGVELLNMNMERLITAVEDSADKSVRAVKSRGNLIA